MSSGIVLNDVVNCVTFHSGYDFGYLLKLLTCRSLPDNQAGFFDFINMYFPMLYDIKHMLKFCNSLHGGLNKLAELLEVERVGVCHQAGSDSLLTSCTFRKLRDNFFNGSTEKYADAELKTYEVASVEPKEQTKGFRNPKGNNVAQEAKHISRFQFGDISNAGEVELVNQSQKN
ncbi:probable CCR4-associated factor 1 homolog 7 [Hibiscus syriacus]|uniref:probable CCR4-associated factor 1 homolog 7 n=1 Tax=Hibiscus syriacus TaxID=106335 RepID=UPI00192442DC|nr:probable CCR4-associated factor 1 homolog 7 [Hibiscus syriacus]